MPNQQSAHNFKEHVRYLVLCNTPKDKFNQLIKTTSVLQQDELWNKYTQIDDVSGGGAKRCMIWDSLEGKGFQGFGRFQEMIKTSPPPLTNKEDGESEEKKLKVAEDKEAVLPQKDITT